MKDTIFTHEIVIYQKKRTVQLLARLQWSAELPWGFSSDMFVMSDMGAIFKKKKNFTCTQLNSDLQLMLKSTNRIVFFCIRM